MSDFINVTNEVAKATIADPNSAALAAGKSLLADGIVYESDGVNWDAVTTGDFTIDTLPDISEFENGNSFVLKGLGPDILAQVQGESFKSEFHLGKHD